MSAAEPRPSLLGVSLGRSFAKARGALPAKGEPFLHRLLAAYLEAQPAVSVPVVILSLLWAEWCVGGCAGLPPERTGQRGPALPALPGRAAAPWQRSQVADVRFCRCGTAVQQGAPGALELSPEQRLAACSALVTHSKSRYSGVTRSSSSVVLGEAPLTTHSVRVAGGFVARGGSGVHRSSNGRLCACNSSLTSWQRWKLAHP